MANEHVVKATDPASRKEPGMPGWWATRAVFAVSALCAVAGLVLWSNLYNGRAVVERTVRDFATASVGGPDQAELDHAAAVFALDMSRWMVFQGLALLVIVTGAVWYLYVRDHLIRRISDTGRAAMRHKTVVAWRVVVGAAVVITFRIPPSHVDPTETAIEHAVSSAYGALSAMAFIQIMLAGVTIAVVWVVSQRARFLLAD